MRWVTTSASTTTSGSPGSRARSPPWAARWAARSRRTPACARRPTRTGPRTSPRPSGTECRRFDTWSDRHERTRGPLAGSLPVMDSNRRFHMLKRRTTLIIVSLLALLIPAAAAQAKPEIAIQDEDVFVSGKTLSPGQGYQRLAELGVHRMRIIVSSDAVETPGGGFDFRQYDRAVNQAAQNGVKVQFTLVGQHPRPNVTDFGRFAAATANHFRGRVDRYAIWNEPNYIAWIKPQNRAPAIYRKLYIAGYKAVKSNDAAAKVFIGETVPYGQGRRAMAPIKFLRKLACVNS